MNIVLNHIHLSYPPAPPALNTLLCCFKRDSCKTCKGRQQHRCRYVGVLYGCLTIYQVMFFLSSESQALNYACLCRYKWQWMLKGASALKVQVGRRAEMLLFIRHVKEQRLKDGWRSSCRDSVSLQVSQWWQVSSYWMYSLIQNKVMSQIRRAVNLSLDS